MEEYLNYSCTFTLEAIEDIVFEMNVQLSTSTNSRHLLGLTTVKKSRVEPKTY